MDRQLMIARLIIGCFIRQDDDLSLGLGPHLPRGARSAVETLELRTDAVAIVTIDAAMIHEVEQLWRQKGTDDWIERVFIRSKSNLERPLLGAPRAAALTVTTTTTSTDFDPLLTLTENLAGVHQGGVFTAAWLAHFALYDLFLHHEFDHLLEDGYSYRQEPANV